MNPFLVVDWRRDFLSAVKELILDRGPDGLPETLVVFPHQRPRRYIMELMTRDADLPKPVFMPRMMAVNELMSALRLALDPSPLRQAGFLDRAFLAHEATMAVAADSRGPAAGLKELDRERFLPWGLRLAALFDELMSHDLTAMDLAHAEGEVQPVAAALLSQMGDIFKAYVSGMENRAWTTPGLDARRAARLSRDAGPGPLALIAVPKAKRVVLAGFNALTGVEEAVFKRLWREGAQVVLHSDPALCGTGSPDPACSEHRNWKKRWGAGAKLMDGPVTGKPPNILFHEGHDLHSQLKAMAEVLGPEAVSNTAVVLPDSQALMPVLHHLPDKDVNISMGYPLARTSLIRLVETMLRLQENALSGDEDGDGAASGDGPWYWRDLLELIRHPYIKMLGGKDAPLRPLLRDLEKRIRRGGKFVAPEDLAPLPEELALCPEPEAAARLWGRVMETCLSAPGRVETPAQLGRCLMDLAALLLPEDPGAEESLWRRFPLDAEALKRLIDGVAPELDGCAVADDPHPRELLFSLLRRLAQSQRVPFEAEPLTGLQVLGMLESRLLHFPRLLVLDANDDLLPGTPGFDPLLPDPLRGLLGLPDGRQRAMVAAHNFHCLLRGAEEAHIFYSSGVSGTGPAAQKSIRSRFVEQLLWDEERRRKRIIQPGEPPLSTVTFPIRGLPPREFAAPATPVIRAALDDLLRKPVSATMLDTWLDCPARFFFNYLTPLKEMEEVAEEGDPAELGSLVHEALRRFLEPHLGRKTDIPTLEPGPLLDDFSTRLRDTAFFERMSLDRRMGLELAGRKRLRDFLASQPETTILALESPVTAALDLGDRVQRIKGFMDRVDRRDYGVVILDYKTGKVNKVPQGLWLDEMLWDNIQNWEPGQGTEIPDMVAGRVPGVQLPLYCLLYLRDKDEAPANAAWVELGKTGGEVPLFGAKFSDEERLRAIREQTPALIRLIISDMLSRETYPARPGPRCRWCPFGRACPPDPKRR